MFKTSLRIFTLSTISFNKKVISLRFGILSQTAQGQLVINEFHRLNKKIAFLKLKTVRSINQLL